MDSGIKTISVSTSFSLVLHALLAVAVLQTQQVMQAAGTGIEIELVSSSFVSDQAETERAAKKADSIVHSADAVKQQAGSGAEKVVNQPSTNTVPAVPEKAAALTSPADSASNDTGDQVRTSSTAASQQKNALIELLHSQISAHKQYPYLARRQRREGVARVEFVLHPDGSVQNPRLLQSSRTTSLDKAALEAVKSIEPFTPAGNFIDRPEAYRVDVVFNVM